MHDALTGTLDFDAFRETEDLGHGELPLQVDPAANVSGAGGGRPRIRSQAFSAIMTTAALVLPPMMDGKTEASATRRFSRPTTRNRGSTTAAASLPMRQVPTG